VQVPKQVPKTIESMRVYDETMVAPGDEEVTGIVSLFSFVRLCGLDAKVFMWLRKF